MHTGEKNKVYRLTLAGHLFRITVNYSDAFPAGDDWFVTVDCRDISGRTESQAICEREEMRRGIFTREVYDACKSAYINATANDGGADLYGDFFTNGPKVTYPRDYRASGRYGYTAVDIYRGECDDTCIYGTPFTGSGKQARSIAAALNEAFAAGATYGSGPNYRRER
jgi:hypothetical protein